MSPFFYLQFGLFTATVVFAALAIMHGLVGVRRANEDVARELRDLVQIIRRRTGSL